jgi:Uncharacterised nucleotidyltransferase
VVREPESATSQLRACDRPAVLELIDLAHKHAVAAWLVRCAPADEPAWQPARQLRDEFRADHLRTTVALRSIGAVFDELSCPWLVLKGRALAEQFYPSTNMRHAVDIDVLVPPARFAAAIAALQANGWELVDRNWPLAAATMPGELRLVSRAGLVLDLHWHVLAVEAQRRRFPLPTTHLLARRQSLPSGISALHPDDQLVHLGLHGALSGANRLSWLLDAALAARACSDWTTAAAAARAANGGRALGLVLVRAERYLGRCVPAAALRAMGSTSAWSASCRLVDRRSPLGLDPNRPALARAVARAVGPTTTRSGSGFARHLAGFLTSGAPRDRPDSPLRDPSDRRSPMFVDEDRVARDAYLRAVAVS